MEIWPFEAATTSLAELAAFVAGHDTRQESDRLITTVRLGDLARVASHAAIRDVAPHHEITPAAE